VYRNQIMISSFYYFDKNEKDIVSLLNEQSVEVCRNKISKKYIQLQTKEYDFGFAHKTPVAQIGQRKTRKKQYHLYSFVLCKWYPEYNEIGISLICSRPYSQEGKQLIECVEKKALELDCNQLSVLSIGETKLMKWYTEQGFVLMHEKHFPDGKLKAYYMRKRIELQKELIVENLDNKNEVF